MKRVLIAMGMLALSQGTGCMKQGPPAAEAEPPPLYNPDFTYNAAETGATSDVAIAVVAPQFSGDGVDWWRDYKSDETTRQMVRQLRTGFEALLVAKGLRVSGPFNSVDEMTYPEKKAAKLVLYPDFDLALTIDASAGIQPKSEAPKKQDQGGSASFSLGDLVNDSAPPPSKPTCSATISVSGAVLLVLKEPLSGQKMWVKKLDVSEPDEELTFENLACENVDGRTRGAHNAWAKTHEEVFQTVMSSLDRYISLEEMQMVASQADPLREQTTFRGQ